MFLSFPFYFFFFFFINKYYPMKLKIFPKFQDIFFFSLLMENNKALYAHLDI